jgi:glutathione S-transferase
LAKTAGIYSVGDEVTLADCSLVPISYNGFRYKVDMEAYPTVLRVLDNLEKLDAFKAAHAHNQPDCLPELVGKSMRDI